MRRLLPWLFLGAALWAAWLILNGTSPGDACSELPGAFDHGFKTRQSEPIEYIVLRCEVTNRSTHETIANTDVNYWGPIMALAGCVGAWLLGSVLAGTVARRKGLIGAAIALGVATLALVAFFL
jgi:hypothetical protein